MPLRRMISILLFLFTLNSLAVLETQAYCVVISDSMRQPVYLRNDTGKYEFVIPQSDGVHLHKGEKLVLLCPGHLNRLNQSNSNITVVTCNDDNRFSLGRKVYDFEKLECKRSIRGSVQNTNTVCPNGLVSYLGYYIGSQFLRLIEVCYDDVIGNTVYTKHMLQGAALNESGFSIPHNRPNFNTKGLQQDNKAVPLIYQIAAQKSRLSTILASSILANNYITNSIFLERGHLSPDADFLFVTWQYTTYFYLNACPQWSSINRANWKRVENMVRGVAKAWQDNFQIITGTHEVLELQDRYDRFKPLYLSQKGKRFPVPRYIWKLVYSEKTKKAIVLVSYNNPYASSGKYLCSCICKKAGWSATEWAQVEKGFIQCCAYEQFKALVPTTPNLPVSGVLYHQPCPGPMENEECIANPTKIPETSTQDQQNIEPRRRSERVRKPPVRFAYPANYFRKK